MVRAVLLGLLAVAALPSCKSRDVQTVSTGAKAGVVVELTGKVTATRAGATRDLLKGGDVSGDDMIETVADASVGIDLVHNRARWNLGGGRKGRVSESTAWGLPMVEGSAAAVAQDTSAAGRHAEHASADTAASATHSTAVVAPTIPTPEVTKVVPGNHGSAGPTVQPSGGVPDGAVNVNTGDPGMGNLGTVGKGGAPRGGKASLSITLGTPTMVGSLDLEVVRQVILRNLDSIRFCSEKDTKTPALEGTLIVKFAVSLAGVVTAATATGIDPAIEACVSGRFKTFTFPKPASITVISYPLTFSREK